MDVDRLTEGWMVRGSGAGVGVGVALGATEELRRGRSCVAAPARPKTRLDPIAQTIAKAMPSTTTTLRCFNLRLSPLIRLITGRIPN